VRRLLASALLALAVCPAAAGAQTLTDERLWFVLTLQEQGSDTSPWRWSGDLILRGRDGASDLDTFSVRPTIIYAVDSHSAVGGGYVFAATYPASGGTTIEHRAFGQYVWAGRPGGTSLSYRARLEARFIEDNSAPSARLRNQLRVSRPIRDGSRVSLVASDEFFLHLNNTTRNARGIDQNRAFAGVAIGVGAGGRVEAGYLNQFSPGHRGAADRKNHVLSTSFTWGF
jgi:hypothetical protein